MRKFYGALYLLMTAFILSIVVLKSERVSVFGVGFALDMFGIQYQNLHGALATGMKADVVVYDNGNTRVEVKKATATAGFGWFLGVRFDELSAGEVIIKSTPSDEAFDFMPISAWITLDVPNLTIGRLTIINKDAYAFDDIHARVFWHNDTLSAKDGRFLVQGHRISKANGRIRFGGRYPMSVHGVIKTNSTAQHTKIHAKLDGDLTRLNGRAWSAWQGDELMGEFTLLPLTDGIPFSAHASAKKLSFNGIALKNARIHATGKLDDEIDLSATSWVGGDNIPKGNYNARATLKGKRLDITALDFVDGDEKMHATGQIDWAQGIRIEMSARADGFKNTHFKFGQYFPSVLNGRARYHYHHDAHDGHQGTHKAELWLDDGEAWQVQTDSKKTHANWQNLNRALPDVGWVNSPQGSLTLTQQGGAYTLNAQARVTKLHRVPMGDYQLNAKKIGHVWQIDELAYQHNNASARIHGRIHTKNKTWQLTADFNDVDIDGVLVDGHADSDGDLQKFSVNLTDFSLTQGSRMAVLNGVLHGDGVSKRADYLGDVAIDIDGKRYRGVLDVAGQLDDKGLHIARLNGVGEFGKFWLSGAGQDTQNWQLSGRVESLELGLAEPITGDVSARAKGGGITADFDGLIGKARVSMRARDENGWVVNVRHQDDGGTAVATLRQISDGFAVVGDFDGADLSVYHKDLGRVAGHLQGEYRGGRFVLHSSDIRGQFFGKELMIKGDLSGDIGHWHYQKDDPVRSVRALIGKLYAVKGDFVARMGDDTAIFKDGQMVLDVADLSRYAKAKGRVRAKITLGAALLVDARVADFSFKNATIKRAQVLASIDDLGEKDSKLRVISEGVAFGDVQYQALDVDARGTLGVHSADVVLQKNDVRVSARARGQKSEHYTLDVLNARIESSQTLTLDAPVRVYDHGVFIAPHCWVGDGRVCVRTPLTDGRYDVAFDNFDIAIISALYPMALRVDGRISGELLADSTQKMLKLDARIDKGAWVDKGVRQAFDGRIQINPSGDVLALDVQANLWGGALHATGALDPYAHTMDTHVSVDGIDLVPMRAYVDGLSALSGKLSGKVLLTGAIKRPDVSGHLQLDNGTLAFKQIPISLKNTQANITLDNTHAKFTSTFNMGAGTGELLGDVDLSDMALNLNIKGQALQLPYQSSEVAVNPNLHIALDPKKKRAKITGTLLLLHALIRPPDDTDAIKVSDNVLLIDRRVSIDAAKILARATPWSIDTNVALDFGNDARFMGFGATLPLTGALHITQSGEQSLNARGMVMVAGTHTISAFGQRLMLNFAQMRFDGALREPSLSMEAARQIGGQSVGVRITGTAKNPIITPFGTGGMSEQQAMSMLLTGNDGAANEAAFEAQVNNTLAAAGLSLGLQGTRELTQQIGRAFGFDNLVLDADASSLDTRVNLTGYITPDLYVRYGVGVFNATNSLSVRYNLTRRVYIEATNALQNTVDVVYSRRF